MLKDTIVQFLQHLNGQAHKHDSSEIDVEGDYEFIPGTPADLETTISIINSNLFQIDSVIIDNNGDVVVSQSGNVVVSLQEST